MSGGTQAIRKDKPLTCLICGRTFESKEALNIHKQKEHSISKEPPVGVG
jgi:hypothetical protein